MTPVIGRPFYLEISCEWDAAFGTVNYPLTRFLNPAEFIPVADFYRDYGDTPVRIP